ncbi:Uu.00g098950.m01.CDS01 [Anthostomella pinea]|uniref:Uu.00g098950.m01.CDS01 n=1 Tax=Anthostomella pinea TaxID=933095 RepID=A0AAI8YF32_9PEZI|nr:Uu.00g098950.m01.CDS01 [Anthostomella pinea]
MDAADQFALRPMPKTFPEIQSKATQNDDQQRIPIPSKERPPKVPSRRIFIADSNGPPLGHFKSFTKRHEEILQQTNSVDFVLDAHGTSNPIVSKGNAQPKGKEAPKARENDPQQPRVISVNNGLDAVRRDTPDQPVSSGAKVAIEPPLDGMDITQDAIPATQNLGSLNAVSKPAGPDKTNGFFMDPKAPRLGFSSDPVPEVNGGSHSTARFATPTSPPRAQRQNHANQAPPVTDAEPLPTVNGVHEENGWQTSSKPPNAEPAAPPPASAPVPEQPRKRYQDPEAKRQALIAEHDPAEFDAYIYGELNRANRPGDALFALRPYARPTPSNDHIRPTTHFAAMDPRIHYAQPHSEAWHRAKHDEIAARGNRKSKTNFGKAAARRARRKREVAAHGDDDGASGGACDVPDHVRRDRKWVSALDELDEMADVTHAKQRAKIRRRKKGKGVEKGKEKGHERGKGPEKEKRKRTESDEDYDEMDTDADADSESDWSRTRRE